MAYGMRLLELVRATSTGQRTDGCLQRQHPERAGEGGVKGLFLAACLIFLGAWFPHGASLVDTSGKFFSVSTVSMTSTICNTKGTATGNSCVLSSDLTIANENLDISGWTFSGAGRLILSGTVSLTGPSSTGTIANLGTGAGQAVFVQDSGSYSIQGITFSGVTAATTALGINPTSNATINLLRIVSNTFTNCNYGYLRNGGLGTIASSYITNNTFSNLQGDAIELNVVPNDANILISGNSITGVNNTHSQSNWGIGIGIAGAAYSENFPVGAAVRNFTITNNTLSYMLQGIHVETGTSFTISNNNISHIISTYSGGSGLQEAGIVTYGAGNFTISNNTISLDDASDGILVAPGSVPGVPTVASTPNGSALLQFSSVPSIVGGGTSIADLTSGSVIPGGTTISTSTTTTVTMSATATGAGVALGDTIQFGGYPVYFGLPINFTISSNTMNANATVAGIYWASTGTIHLTNNTGPSFSVYPSIGGNVVQSGNSW